MVGMATCQFYVGLYNWHNLIPYLVCFAILVIVLSFLSSSQSYFLSFFLSFFLSSFLLSSHPPSHPIKISASSSTTPFLLFSTLAGHWIYDSICRAETERSSKWRASQGSWENEVLHCTLLNYCSTLITALLLHPTVLYYTVLYYTILHCGVLCIVLYCIVLYCIVLYCIVLYCIVLYCTTLYCTVLYCTIVIVLLNCCYLYSERFCSIFFFPNKDQ